MREFAMEKRTTRQAFGEGLFAAAQHDDTLMGLGADTTNNMGMQAMEKAFPDRVINTGIAEQNMMDIAAGLAATGYHVFAASFAPFVCMRALEQFRTFICYPNLNVKVGGGMAGLSAGVEGVTHQCLEDIGIMRLLPNNMVIVPADANATEVIVREIAKVPGPAYIRTGKTEFHGVFGPDYTFTLGKANLLEPGSDVTIIANGQMVARALQAHDVLHEQGIQARVLEFPFVKPLDTNAILRAAKETGALVVAEEHYKVGGLCGAVCECLSQTLPTPVELVAAPDCFGESGYPDDLLDKYGLSVKDIVQAAQKVIGRKSVR